MLRENLMQSMRHHEQYKTLCISTGDLGVQDLHNLKHIDSQMVMERDTGFFIKLYDEEEYNMDEFQGLDWKTKVIINAARDAGFRMIEIDCDADRLTADT